MTVRPAEAAVKTIADPWHSRPIDIHRWSDHPEALQLAERLWTTHFSDFGDEDRKTGPKPKTSYRNQLKVVILDLFVAWKTDPELSIGVPMSATGWDSNSRYNALKLTKKIILIVKRLHECGLIDLAAGSYSGPWGRGNRNTRIRAAKPLVQLFEEMTLRIADVRQHPNQECIVLRGGGHDEENSRLVDYEDTDRTRLMRKRLRAYNDLLARTFVDIPTLETDYVERSDQRWWGERTVRLPTDATRNFVRRVFSRGSLELNGRFYGGWWQHVSKEQRGQIFINDTPTVEVDFKGLHVAILSAEKGVRLEDDPYTLPEKVLPFHPLLQRRIVKELVLTAINARDRSSAYRAFRDGWKPGTAGRALKNEDLDRVLEAFLRKHPHLSDSMCADQGIRLMYRDSLIAELVIHLLTSRGIPVLCVHDSFIVDYTNVELLKKVMRKASRKVTGFELPVASEGLGLDEMEHSGRDRNVILDFINWRQTPRCPEYLERLAAHEARLASEGGQG